MMQIIRLKLLLEINLLREVGYVQLQRVNIGLELRQQVTTEELRH